MLQKKVFPLAVSWTAAFVQDVTFAPAFLWIVFDCFAISDQLSWTWFLEWESFFYSLFVDGNIGTTYVPVSSMQSKISTSTEGHNLLIYRNQQCEVITCFNEFAIAQRYGYWLDVCRIVLSMRLDSNCFMVRDYTAFGWLPPVIGLAADFSRVLVAPLGVVAIVVKRAARTSKWRKDVSTSFCIIAMIGRFHHDICAGNFLQRQMVPDVDNLCVGISYFEAWLFHRRFHCDDLNYKHRFGSRCHWTVFCWEDKILELLAVQLVYWSHFYVSADHASWINLSTNRLLLVPIPPLFFPKQQPLLWRNQRSPSSQYWLFWVWGLFVFAVPMGRSCQTHWKFQGRVELGKQCSLFYCL